MDRLLGLPAHPLLVHIPVAMLPLAMAGVVVMLIRRAWYERYKWAVLAIGAIGTLGAILAAASGEGLEKQIAGKEGQAAARAAHDHAEAGDLARTLAIVFFVFLALYVLLPWFLERRAASRADADQNGRIEPSWLRPALMVAVAITGIASMVSIIEAGHSGAAKAWEDYSDSSLDGG
jgi:preprotein translocase subunit SecG